jgi:hypothetical protein
MTTTAEPSAAATIVLPGSTTALSGTSADTTITEISAER